MHDQILQLETSIANIKADITVLERALENLKHRDAEISEKVQTSHKNISNINQDIYKLKLTHDTDITNFKQNLSTLEIEVSEVKEDMANLTKSINKIDSKLETVASSIKNNVLLDFTSELDLKKLILIIATVISLVSSPSLLSLAWEQAAPNESEKIDIIIELLKEKQNVSHPSQ